MTTVGSLIKSHREKFSWSQSTLADKMGLEQQAVMRYEKDEHDPPLSKIRQFGKVLEINKHDLFSAIFPNESDEISVKEKNQKYGSLQDTLKSIGHFAKLEPPVFKKLNLKQLIETVSSADKHDRDFLISTINSFINHFQKKE